MRMKENVKGMHNFFLYTLLDCVTGYNGHVFISKFLKMIKNV